MPETPSFDLRRFQNMVIREYETIKFLRNPPDPFDGMKENIERAGCLGQFFWPRAIRIVRGIEKETADHYKNTPETIKLQNRAKAILADEEIRTILCPLIAGNIQEELMPAEVELVLIRILTESLTADDVAQKHRIPHNPKLFAYMVRHLVEIGVMNWATGENEASGNGD